MKKEIDNKAGNEEVPDRPICRSDRVHNKPDRSGSWVSYTPLVSILRTMCVKIVEPKNIEEALSGSHCKEWKEAADSECQSF